MRISLTLTGTTALIMHDEKLANPANPIAKQIKEITDKKKNKTDADIIEVQRLEFIGGLYLDRQDHVVVPAANILKCLRNAAAARREGKKIERGLLPLIPEFPLVYPATMKDPRKLWDRQEHRFLKGVRVGASRVQRMRPMFPDWQVTAEFLLVESQLNPRDLARIVNEAGVIEGLGDGRTLGMGRFTGKVAAVEEPLSEAA